MFGRKKNPKPKPKGKKSKTATAKEITQIAYDAHAKGLGQKKKK